jgi:hypothetical protein
VAAGLQIAPVACRRDDTPEAARLASPDKDVRPSGDRPPGGEAS